MPRLIKGDVVLDVDDADVERYTNRGYTVDSDEAEISRAIEAGNEDRYTGIRNKIDTAVVSGLDGLTAGLSTAGLSALGGAEYIRETAERNPITSGVFKVGGAIAGSLATPGSALAHTPAAAISRLGARVAKTAEGAGAVAKIGRAAVGGAVEGALFGAGEGVSELALSEDPLTLERASSVLSSKMLYGGVIGGVAGSLGKVAEIGLTKAKRTLGEMAERASKAETVADDLAQLDAKGLRAAEATERDALIASAKSTQATSRSAVVDDLVTYRKQVQETNPYLAFGDDAALAKRAVKSKNTLRNAMDDLEGMRANPTGALKSLRVEAQAFKDAIAAKGDIAARLASVDDKIARRVKLDLDTLPDGHTVELVGKDASRYSQFTGARVGKEGIKIGRDEAETFLGAIQRGEVKGASQKALDGLETLLERNKAIQAQIESSVSALPNKADLISDRLEQIATARDALTSGGAKKSIGEQMAGGTVYGMAAGAVGSIPFVGPMLAPFAGAKASTFLSEKVFGRLGKAAGDTAQRSSRAVEKFLDVTKKVTPAAPVLATKVLASVSYGPGSVAKESAVRPDLVTSYKARSEEIRSQVEPGPDGRPMMRTATRSQMAKQLSPVRAVNPIVADKMETIAARRIEFLASKLPRRADIGGMQTGPDRWQPSEMAMRAFARYVAAVEDPGGVEERLADGTVTPEDAEVMRQVYPERLNEMKRQIIERLPTLQASLPYARRLSLSIFSGIPVDPAMNPKILRVLQGQFADEPDTDGGTHAPKPKPQFGSVSKPPSTPAQDRAS